MSFTLPPLPYAPDALELLGKAPDPAKAAKLTRAQISAALPVSYTHLTLPTILRV